MKPPNLLTPRQEQVLRLICEGHKNFSAAVELKIGIKTIEKHKDAIRTQLKMGFFNDVRLVAYAIAHGYIEPISWANRICASTTPSSLVPPTEDYPQI